MLNALQRLSVWYTEQCNGVWEHEYGINIDTLDNPGWTVTIDLSYVDCHAIAKEGWKYKREIEDTWVHAKIEGSKFKAACDPMSLNEVIELFLKEVVKA
jgi:hypothetical protein